MRYFDKLSCMDSEPKAASTGSAYVKVVGIRLDSVDVMILSLYLLVEKLMLCT